MPDTFTDPEDPVTLASVKGGKRARNVLVEPAGPGGGGGALAAQKAAGDPYQLERVLLKNAYWPAVAAVARHAPASEEVTELGTLPGSAHLVAHCKSSVLVARHTPRVHPAKTAKRAACAARTIACAKRVVCS
jgi:hypothetical protein